MGRDDIMPGHEYDGLGEFLYNYSRFIDLLMARPSQQPPPEDAALKDDLPTTPGGDPRCEDSPAS